MRSSPAIRTESPADGPLSQANLDVRLSRIRNHTHAYSKEGCSFDVSESGIPGPAGRSLVAAAPGRPDRRFDAESVEFFEKKVRPLLVNNCNNCHSASTNSKGGLRVDDRNGLIQGGNRGPAVVPGDPENSLLIQAVRQTTTT